MPILPEKTKLYSIVYSKCARCHVGDLYEDANPYHLRKLGAMKKECPCCGQAYEPEVGFYYGAMYASYGLGVAQAIPLLVILWPVLRLDSWVIFSALIGSLILLWPLNFRMARNLWLNIFVGFDEDAYRAAKAGCGKAAHA